MMQEVILAASARRDFISITDYLFEEFGAVGLQRFLVRFEDIRKNLLDNPKMYRVAFKRQNIRKCVLTRQCVIILQDARRYC